MMEICFFRRMNTAPYHRNCIASFHRSRNPGEQSQASEWRYALLLLAALTYYGITRGWRALVRLGRNAILIPAAALSLAAVFSALEKLTR